MGELAPRLRRSRALYRGLHPEAAAALDYIGRRVRELSGAEQPLIVTSTLRDGHYQRALLRRNAMAPPGYSLHTTGYAFDIARVYESKAQAAAFQFVLERLQARGLIAWIREPHAIHIPVAKGSGMLAGYRAPHGPSRSASRSRSPSRAPRRSRSTPRSRPRSGPVS